MKLHTLFRTPAAIAVALAVSTMAYPAMAQTTAATKLMGEHKYYESNLALKAAEDGLRMDTVVLSEAPAAPAAAKSKG